jgi:prepilin-type N-terminal cleavage/methylation domain-containing protein
MTTAVQALIGTVVEVRNTSACPRRAFTFIEVIVVIVLAGVLATVAVAVYSWALSDTGAKIVRNDAREFERNVRSMANTELRAPTSEDALLIAGQLTVDESALSITAAGDGYEVSRNGVSVCVTFGNGVNTAGTITDGSCV